MLEAYGFRLQACSDYAQGSPILFNTIQYHIQNISM